MLEKLNEILLMFGYDYSHSLETSVLYTKADTSISVYADKILVSGPAEHTICTRGLDEYDVMMLLQVLKLINIEDIDTSNEPAPGKEEMFIPSWPNFYRHGGRKIPQSVRGSV